MAHIDVFSFAQMTSNRDGKTSGTGSMGVLICVVGTLSFILGCVDKVFLNKDIEIVTQSIIFVGIGASLLGYRKSQEKHVEPEVVLPESTADEPIIDDVNDQNQPLNS